MTDLLAIPLLLYLLVHVALVTLGYDDIAALAAWACHFIPVGRRLREGGER